MSRQILLGLAGLTGLLESSLFTSLKISLSDNEKAACVYIKKTLDQGHFIVSDQDCRTDETSIFTFDEIISVIVEHISKDFKFVQVDTLDEKIFYKKKGKSWKMERQPSSSFQTRIVKPFDIGEIKRNEELKNLLTELGITTDQGTVRQKQKDKLEQIQKFTEIFVNSLKEAELMDMPELSIWDAACGKSYLSFLLYYHLHSQMNLDVRSIGIDINRQLIERCDDIKNKMKYDGMKFVAESNQDLLNSENTDKMDVLYSLHACNTATDEAIALGITKQARLIIVAPCCQREIKEQMKGNSIHVLKGVTKYPFLKERLADVVTDAMRSLVLESAGYRVKVLKFVPSEITPKNIIIIAFKTKKKKDLKLSEDYRKIKDFFHLNPMLEKMLSQVFKNNS